MNNNNFLILIVILIFPSFLFGSSSNNFYKDKISIDINNQSSLQRGANIFMENCFGCHSLKYVRYKDMAEGVGLISSDGSIIDKNFVFLGNNIYDSVSSSLSKNDSLKWFGTIPPDLSLISKYRGVDWLYNYMRSFYYDSNKIWGVNNLIFPGVNMPHVLVNYQGIQIAKYDDSQGVVKSLEIIKDGSMSISEYNSMIRDLVSFLSYVGDPNQIKRKNIGFFVILFLIFFSFIAYFLKKEYWKDIK